MRVGVLALILAGLANVPGGAAVTPAPVVIELFTSQGCSSCPPADQFVSELARNPRLVVFSRPVTYWDGLGWKDTLARPENTALQHSYAAHANRGAGVYTPQIIVQGRDGAVGSSRSDVFALIKSAATSEGPLLTVNGNTLTVSGAKGRANVRLIALTSTVSVKIGRGENSRRTIHYSNVVRSDVILGVWNGGTARFALTPAMRQIRGVDRYAIIVQGFGAGPILAARYL
jgi:hypothetical protein